MVLVKTYRWRARSLRFVAIVHVFVGLLFVFYTIAAISEGVREWQDSIEALHGQYQHPDLVSGTHWWYALECFAIAPVVALIAAASFGISFGLWKFRRWPGWVATAQGFLLLAIGCVIALYQLFAWREPSGGGWMVPGLVFVLVAGYIRSRKSAVVCSEEYRTALAEISR